MQLCMPSNAVLELSRQLFEDLKSCSITDWELCLSNTFVALDEANVALTRQFGMYESGETQEKIRPFLACISDALEKVPTIFSGTSHRLSSAIDSAVSNMADVASGPKYFAEMTRFQSKEDICAMMKRFGIDVSGVPTSELAPLFGRCRFVASAIGMILEDLEESSPPLPVEDTIKETIYLLRVQLASQIKERLAGDALRQKQIEKIVVAAMIDQPLRYDDADEATKEWADDSFFWVAGRKRTLEVEEPLMVRAIQRSMPWDPIQWIVNRITNEPAKSASQQGVNFEQISARKLAVALSNGTVRIHDSERNTVPISLTPDGATALVIKSPSMTLDEFLATPQCTHMFLPANKDGPGVVFWVMSSDETWYAVFVQSKYYQDKISEEETQTAAKTVLHKGNLGAQHRRLQVFFPFMGATCTASPSLLSSSCDQDNNVYMYLDHENDGKRVPGEDVCEQLLAVKSREKMLRR